MRRANARPSMLHGLVADTELAQVEADHLRLDLDLVELLARVDANHTPDHFRHYDHIPQVCLDEVGLFVGFGGLLRLAELLDQTHRAAFQPTVEASPRPRVDEGDELGRGEVEESTREYEHLRRMLCWKSGETDWSRSTPR
jgi:hypothetical protein